MSDYLSRTSRDRAHCLVLSAILSVGIAGCGGAVTSVTGQVTYKGDPVSRGVITITPTDGKGKPEGTKILDGAYEITTITPGPKTISVIGVVGNEAVAQQPLTSDDKAQALAPKQGIVEIPVGAEGNGQEIEIKEGPQQVDIKLGAPAGRNSR